jgi:5'-3' exonuclease
MDVSQPVVLCDTSYIIFYRYYAILAWYKKQSTEKINIDGLIDNPEFIAKYEKTFDLLVQNIAKQNQTEFSNIVFAKDCSRDNIWRMKYFPEYKGTRDDSTRNFNGEIFKYTYNVLFPKLKVKYGFHEIHHPNLEADDIIAILTKEIRKANIDNTITIITNDNDYLQLRMENLIIKNLQNKNLRERAPTDNYLLYKIILGDKSDNISAISKKIGEKTALKLVNNSALLEELVKNSDTKAKYELNTLLIDFNSIPSEHTQALLSTIHKYLLKEKI